MQAILLAVAVALAANALVSPSDWMQFRLYGRSNAVLSGTLSASWHLVTNGGFSSSPTMANGTLYVGNNHGDVYAIDPPTGKVKWQHHFDNPIMSAAIVYHGTVIVGEGNENSPSSASPSHPIRVGTPPNALLGLNANTGALVWRYQLPGSGMPSPAVINGILVHHNGYGTVVALDPLSGRLAYQRTLHSIASMSAAIPIGGDAFVTSGVDPTAVWALHSKDGSVIWRSDFASVSGGLGDCPAATDGSRVYCDYAVPPTSAVPMQTERQGQTRAFAIDVRSGKKVWDVPLDQGMIPIRNESAIPMFAENSVYIGSSVAPVMHAIDPVSGQTKWRMNTRAPVKGGIVDVGGTLYFGDLAGYLWAVNASNGQVIGVKYMRTPFNVGSPIVAGQTLIIGSRGGTLQAVPLAAIRAARDTSSPSPAPRPQSSSRKKPPGA